MTTDLTILDALRAVIGDAAYEAAAAMNARRTYNALDHEDPETILRSLLAPISSSQSYRRAADMPREPWMDELAVAVGDYREEWS